MNIVLILGHPDTGSFNHAIAETCKDRLLKNNHTVTYHDLYQEKFDPALTASEIPKNGLIDNIIKTHCDELKNCDGIIIVHPNWWGQPPALVKGWIDRVIRPGVAYEFLDGDSGEGVPIGLLKAHAALIFNTANTSEARENKIFKDPLETIWKNCVFGLCGVKHFDRRMFRIIVTSTEDQRKKWLDEVNVMIDRYFPEGK
jgi:NAD(P)H dehydrogenase (quinone)